jgi:hypothetical protein
MQSNLNTFLGLPESEIESPSSEDPDEEG